MEIRCQLENTQIQFILMIAKYFTYPPAITPRRSIFTAFTSVVPCSGAVPKANSILPMSCLPFNDTFPSLCLKHTLVVFLSIPAWPADETSQTISYQICPQATRTITRFSPSKGWDQSQWHCQHELGHGGSQCKMGRLKQRHSSPSQAINENRSPFSSGSHLFS